MRPIRVSLVRRAALATLLLLAGALAGCGPSGAAHSGGNPTPIPTLPQPTATLAVPRVPSRS